MEESKWTLLAALLPPNFELNEQSAEEAILSDGSKEIKLIYNKEDGSYVVDGITLHFEDTEDEVVFTLLIPYLLSLFDGNQRL